MAEPLLLMHFGRWIDQNANQMPGLFRVFTVFKIIPRNAIQRVSMEHWSHCLQWGPGSGPAATHYHICPSMSTGHLRYNNAWRPGSKFPHAWLYESGVFACFSLRSAAGDVNLLINSFLFPAGSEVV